MSRTLINHHILGISSSFIDEAMAASFERTLLDDSWHTEIRKIKSDFSFLRMLRTVYEAGYLGNKLERDPFLAGLTSLMSRHVD